MDDILDQLKSGVRRFQAEVYPQRAEMFAQAASEPQRPHTLFITCADSRIDPVEITGAGTGDVFVTRNIGNMVPAYPEMLGSTSAVIEFAVSGLGVGHVVVCGHSDCGAMKALLDPDSVERMPTVKTWLRNAHAALTAAGALYERDQREGSDRSLLQELTEQNVLLQMNHLKTHPSIAGAIAGGKLSVSGWIYEIGSGEVRIAHDGERTFTSVKPSGSTGSGERP